MITELTKENLREIEDSFISKEEVEKEIENNPFAKYFLLKEDNEIIGYIYYSDIYERVEINQFEIKENHRNCGKGQKLLAFFLRHVEKDVTLEVREDNIPAIKLYEKMGFTRQAIRKGYYNGIDGILMERKNNDKRL